MDYIIEIFNILSDLLFTQDNTHYQAVAPAVVIMGLQTAFSAGQAIKGGIDKRKAEEAQRKAIASYENKLRNIEIQNRLQALRVPTMGAELRERGIARATTAGIESMQEAGAEAVLGGVPRVVTAADAQSAQVAAELDRMQAIRDQEFLREEQRIEEERARREEQIAGIETMRARGAGAAAADAAMMQQAGVAGIASGLGGMAVQSAIAEGAYGNQPTARSQSELTPMQPRQAAVLETTSTVPELRTTPAQGLGEYRAPVRGMQAQQSLTPQLAIPQGYDPNMYTFGQTNPQAFNPYVGLTSNTTLYNEGIVPFPK